MGKWLLLIIGLAVAPPAFAQSVVDHYRSLMAQVRDPYAYTLTQTAGSWRARAAERTSIVAVVVDIPNGFVQINDEGTGGGNLVTEVALFKPTTGGPILAVSQRFYSGVDPWGGKARFYRQAGGRWEILPAVALPALTPAIFVSGRIAQATADDDSLSPVIVHLPRVGTTVDIYLVPSTHQRCPEQNWLGTSDPAAGCNELAAAPNWATLAFDVARGTFGVTRRDRKNAPKLQ